MSRFNIDVTRMYEINQIKSNQLLYKDDMLSVYEENSDCCRVSKVVLQENSFKI